MPKELSCLTEWLAPAFVATALHLSTAVFASGQAMPCGISREYVYAGDGLLASVGPPLPTVSFESLSTSVSEAQPSVSLSVQVTTTDGCPTRSEIAVPFTIETGTAISGGDYVTPSPGPLRFPAGVTHNSTQVISVPLVPDHAIEPDEWFQVTLGTPSQATLGPNVRATVTILDNDTPVVSFRTNEGVVREDGVWLAPSPAVQATTGDRFPLPYPLQVAFVRADDTTQGSADISLDTPSPLSFAAGTPSGTSVDLQFSVVQDAIIEGDETLRLELSSGSGYLLGPRTATITVRDDDVSPPLALHSVAPCRLVDTRNPPGPFGGPALTAGQARTFQVAGRCGVPLDARAVLIGLAAITPSVQGHLKVFPPGTAAPGTSVVNFAAGDVLAAGGHFLLDPSGRLNVLPVLAQGNVHVVLDVLGYFQ